MQKYINTIQFFNHLVQNTYYLLDKIKEYGNDTNYDVNCNRSFNFYSRKGSDKNLNGMELMHYF